tara:strand:- start:244 stop:735 length:492 start_codon:yes stop_codon:yes gene_type:complete
MIIKLKNKDKLLIDEFEFECCIGKGGLSKNKKEGDKCTPKGIYTLGKVYYRPDRVRMPKTNLIKKKISKNYGWCDDPHNSKYNKEVKLKNKVKAEKLFRKDASYDIFIVINYNKNKIKAFKGSAIFLHLTKNYKPTNGCIAIKKKDMMILLKIIQKKTKIYIN